MLQPAACAKVLAGDAQDRAFEDLSVLARAGQLITGAMVDTATAISAGTKLLPAEKVLLQSGPSCTMHEAADEIDCMQA
jgi:hypothetical protein